MELVTLIVGLLVSGVGLYLSHSLRRQQSLKVAEQRMASYGELWKLMEIARPSRLTPWEAATKESLGRYATDEGDWTEGGERVMRQLSLLRQQMKLDLNIYGVSYFENENEDDNPGERVRKRRVEDEFLCRAGIDPRRWRRPPWRQRLLAARRNPCPPRSVAPPP